MTVAAGETVTMTDFRSGQVSDATGSGANWVTIVGPITATQFRVDETNQVVADDWLIDSNGATCQCVHIENSTEVTFKNGEVREGNAAGGVGAMIWIGSEDTAGGYVFDNNEIHDATVSDGTHTECMYAWSVTDMTLTRNHFYNCPIMDVFITGHGGDGFADDYLVENNVFEEIAGGGNAFQFRDPQPGNCTDPTDPSPGPNNWNVRYNTYVGNWSQGVCQPSGPDGNTFVGNVWLNEGACGTGNTLSYSTFNSAFSSCGTNATSTTLASITAGFTAPGSHDYSITSGSILKNTGNTSDYPTLDKAGSTRYSGSAPDRGAYEFQGA
jgi:hypothetical protein